jgi:signal transduction histidine kinase/CheY-like chemotaxis protein
MADRQTSAGIKPKVQARLQDLVAERLGVLPNFFCTAASAPGLIDRLWNFARSAYFDSPLPSLFKERLFVHLSRFCEVRYCIIRHVGFLVGQGYPAGDRDCPPQTVEQVVALLRRPVPSDEEFTRSLERLQAETTTEMPASGTQREADLFDALSLIFLEPRQSGPARLAVAHAFGETNLEMLIAFLAFIRTAHYWTETHPELECEPDMLSLMSEHSELARLLLNQSEAERTWSPMERARLLSELSNREVALRDLNDRLEAEVQDRTRELLAAEEALRQSQKMEAVGQLTGGLAHDFNNLLIGITGSLELLQTRIAQGRIKDADRYINAAQGAAKRAAALTHRLLAFSRRQTLDPKPTDVSRLVGGMEELIRRTMGPEITVEVPVGAAGLWPTLVDPGQLESSLLNLCINARDAMPNGGKLTVEICNRWLDEHAARERDLTAGEYVSLCVSDTGTGMPKEVIARAFDPFFTTKPIGQGTGLGLSMIYGFARQSGGQVQISSEVGQGTTVCIYLPRHLGEAVAAELPSQLAGAPRAELGQTVLVVDDEATVRMLVTQVLEDLGYQAIEAADGAAGLRVLQSDARVDLLVTDVGLPGGMNGRQLADAARVARPDLKVLFITGYAENAVLNHGHLSLGMHVLIKPFALEVLASRIKELIDVPKS